MRKTSFFGLALVRVRAKIEKNTLLVKLLTMLKLFDDCNTLKRELVDPYAYILQPSLRERVIVDWHGCHTALYFGVKAKVPTLYCLPKLHKNPINQDVLLILGLVRQQNFLNCLPCVLQLLKTCYQVL